MGFSTSGGSSTPRDCKRLNPKSVKGRNIKRKDEYHNQLRRNIPTAWMALRLFELQPEAAGTQYDRVRARAERQASLTFAKLSTLYNYVRPGQRLHPGK